MNHAILDEIRRLDQDNIKTVIVTKNQSLDDVLGLTELGFNHFAENKYQAIVEKLKHLDNVTFDFIGRIQTNKVKGIVRDCELIHSVSSIKVLDKIDSEANKIDKLQAVLLQVNISGEATKDGFELNEIIAAYNHASSLCNVKVQGIMVIGNHSDNEELIIDTFKQANSLFIKLRQLDDNITTLSMGMSNDYHLAIKCGANYLRLGSIVFKEQDELN